MKQILLTTIAAVVLVGCGNSELDENLRRDAYFGDIEAVKKHLDEGARVNSADSEFLTTALHDAASQGHYKIVKILIDNGAELNANDAEGMTPLDAAILAERSKKLDSEISDLLRSQGARSGAETSLLVATSLGDIQSIKKLLKAGLDINKPTSRGNTLLHVTASYGHKNATEFILASGANINAIDDQGRTPLFEAVRSREKEIVELLIAKGADINTDIGLHRLAWAYSDPDWSEEEQRQEKVRRHEKTEIAKLLISKGVDVNWKNTKGYNALHDAAQSGFEEMAALLIESGININESNKGNQTPLHKAAFNGRNKIVNILIQNGVNINPVIQSAGSFNGMTPVDFALTKGKISTAALLRKNGGVTGEEFKILITKNNKNQLQNQLIIEAIRDGDLNAVKSRISEGEDVNSVDEKGMLPLQIATVFNRVEIVELLIDKGADVNGADIKFGQTALYAAAFGKRKNIAEVLIKSGAKVNTKIPRGDTPLHAATMSGNSDIAELLIAHGANVNSQITFGVAKGWTPLDLATSFNNPNKNKKITTLLRKHGAKTGEELKAEGK